MEPSHLLTGMERAARARRDAAAIESPRAQSFSYGALDAYSRALAHHLIAAGISIGDRVAILGEKSPHLVAAIYGVLRAGAAYVPLNSDWPAARIKVILEDVEASALIADREYEPLLQRQPGRPPIIWTSEGPDHDGACLPAVFTQEHSHDPLPELSGAELAYIIYTSGSTGVPKGVMHTHRSALAFAQWAAGELDIQPGDRVSSHAPFNFDISIFDLFATSLAGATLVLPPLNVQSMPKRFVAWLEEQEITTAYSVPGLWVAALHQGTPTPLRHPHLRRIIYAGEPMAPKHVLELQQALPHARIYNFYGPTETNVCTAFPIPPLDPERLPDAIPIGTAVSGNRVTVEDGELIVSGASVMSGYWKHEPRAADQPYETGDLVSWNDDLGGYVFLGRRDSMRKIRGFRVELGEVEACLLRHPGTAEAIAMVDDSDDMHHTLVAFVVPNSGSKGSTIELKKHCARFLPPYMIPRINWRSELPRTATGKVDRIALQKQLEEAAP